MFILYAHRGASSYAPENTMRSFCLGYEQGANGIETDIQCTKDGQLVLFHDKCLENLTGYHGKICEYSYNKLLSLKVNNPDGSSSNDGIVRLEDLLRFVKEKHLFVALEIKQDNIIEKIIDQIEKFQLQSVTTVTSFDFKHIKELKTHHPSIRTGYLVCKIDNQILEQTKQVGVEEICPSAATLTQSDINRAREYGLSIRAWGVRNIDDAKKMISYGINGMTVNFPDLCVPFLK